MQIIQIITGFACTATKPKWTDLKKLIKSTLSALAKPKKGEVGEQMNKSY